MSTDNVTPIRGSGEPPPREPSSGLPSKMALARRVNRQIERIWEANGIVKIVAQLSGCDQVDIVAASPDIENALNCAARALEEIVDELGERALLDPVERPGDT